MSTCIEVIEDDPACRDLLHDLLSEEDYAVHLFPDSATAARCLRALAPAAIILDVRLENPHGRLGGRSAPPARPRAPRDAGPGVLG